MKRSKTVHLTALGLLGAAVLLGGCDDTYETYNYQNCTNSAGVAVDPSLCRSASPGFVWYYTPHPIIIGSHPFGGSYSRTYVSNNHWYSSSPSSGSGSHVSTSGGSFKGSTASPVSRGGFGSSSFGGGS